jgi:MATE family multidrug resistance protein
MISSMLGFAMNIVDLLFVGHLGTQELAAAAMGNTLWATVALPLQGCASALDTFLSQSYGANQLEAYGHWVQVATLCMTGLSVPVAGFLALAEPILISLGQEPRVAVGAARFCVRLIPGVPPFIAFLCLSKCLQAQNILAPAVYIALLANVLNCAVNWLLIHALGLGIDGAPLATSCSRWVQFVVLVCYLYGARERLGATLPGLRFDMQQLPSRASSFFRLGAPGALMLALEAWSFDFSTLMAGYLGELSLDAHTVMLNIVAFTFVSFPLALGIAAAIHVGHHLGAGDAIAARLVAKLTVSLTLAVMSSLALLKFSVRHSLGYLFTTDAAVVAKVASLVYIAALFQVRTQSRIDPCRGHLCALRPCRRPALTQTQSGARSGASTRKLVLSLTQSRQRAVLPSSAQISDGLQAAVAGVMRGMGRQRLVAGLNFVGFWLIGLPVGASLTFAARVGVAGLWWGLFAGLTSVATIGVVALLRTDWEAEARRALIRIDAHKNKAIDSSTTTLGHGMEVEMGAAKPTPPTPDDCVRLPHTVL